MRKWLFRLIKILGSLLLMIVIVSSVMLVVAIRRPFPQYEGQIMVDGLQEEISIYRDEFGIPHIFAQNEQDLFFAQGYVHAQDRFWQMEFSRRLGQGRLSELFGSFTVDLDKFVRTLGWNRIAESTMNDYSANNPEMMRILDAYSAGVNAYIQENADDLAFELTLIDIVNEEQGIEPWQPIDTISWGIVMAYTLGGNMNDELARSEVIAKTGEEAVSELIIPYDYARRPVIVPNNVVTDSGPQTNNILSNNIVWKPINAQTLDSIPLKDFIFGHGAAIGSNSWVVSGEFTDSGLPLLANDPHLGVQLPSIWYEVRLHAPGYNVVGFSMAGVPGVVVGYNDNIAWGIANAGVDVQDLFIERLNSDNPDQYEFRGEWQDIEVVSEVIKVNGEDDIVLEIPHTVHGPIINNVYTEQDDTLTLQWSAHNNVQTTLQAIILLNQAVNYTAFYEALSYWDSPSLSFVYADIEGNIAYQLAGQIPIREFGNGTVPVPGWTGEYEWSGWIPYEKLPASLNPESGYIVAANHAIVDESYPYLLAATWDSGNRAQRITGLLQAALAEGEISTEDFRDIQLDSKSLLAADLIPLLADVSSDDSEIQATLDLLADWDLELRRDSVPAALIEIFRLHLEEAILADEIGNIRLYDENSFLQLVVGEADAHWWDNIETEEVETRDQILLAAWIDTIEWFQENLGHDSDDWTWGNLHKVTFRNTPLGELRGTPLPFLLNRGPFVVDGGGDVINAADWRTSDPAMVNTIPSMRMIVDMGNMDASIGVNSTGQSGHPYHPHYDDMIPLWANGEYHSLILTTPATQDLAEARLILEPKRR